MGRIAEGWTIMEEDNDQGQTIYSMNVGDPAEGVIKQNVEAAIEQAIALLHDNITDDSMFFVCGWDQKTSILRITVTDDTKKNESPHVVQVTFLGLQQQLLSINTESPERFQEQQEDYSNHVRYWVRDYLTTSNGFMRYSLVSAFYDHERQTSDLL